MKRIIAAVAFATLADNRPFEQNEKRDVAERGQP